MSAKWYYVCDACGSLTSRDKRIPQPCYDWKCDDCDSVSAWEFNDHRKADMHSAHIQGGLASGLFRRVRS